MKSVHCLAMNKLYSFSAISVLFLSRSETKKRENECAHLCKEAIISILILCMRFSTSGYRMTEVCSMLVRSRTDDTDTSIKICARLYISLSYASSQKHPIFQNLENNNPPFRTKNMLGIPRAGKTHNNEWVGIEMKENELKEASFSRGLPRQKDEKCHVCGSTGKVIFFRVLTSKFSSESWSRSHVVPNVWSGDFLTFLQNIILFI